jgi:ADP-heptose:LPS heptosyltransferase
MAPPAGLELLALGDELRGFDDTAAAVAALDLVIAVDTSVAHLAGTLGVPVWLLHGFGNHWLWQLERHDSPWYPSLRIFRQHEPNRWEGLFADVRLALEAWAADATAVAVD